MKPITVVLTLALCGLAACNKSASPAAASNNPAASSAASPMAPAGPNPVTQKLQEYSGTGATNCGTLDARAAEAQLKAASDCSMQASQGKKPFYVSYEMPGMGVGVASNAEGKLFTVQTQGATGALSSGACPSALRVASSGRVTCFAPGDMGSMSGSHTAGSMPPGATNPHATGKTNPHAATPPKTN
jgi:hypothetical protein